MRSNRFWVVLLCFVVAVSAGAAFLQRGVAGSIACVYQDGVLVESIDLTTVVEPYTFFIESDTGMNLVSVENGRIRVFEADCPDGACVRQGWLSGGRMPIVCLPHRLVIELEGRNTSDLDAVVG